MDRNRLRLRRLALALALLFAARAGASLVLLVRGVHDALRARLEQAFGRPVEVGRFDVSVWSGPRLEAHYVTVGDDPQFGYEFLLRADRLSAAPDWRALLRGRLLFRSFSFDRPSLNLVRNPDGRWNFVAWAAASRTLPAASGAPHFPASGAGRVDGIAVSNGRINFKRGADKLPFALVSVNGRLSPGPDGRWSIALEAQPLRAGVTLQDAGTLRFTGMLPAAALSAAAAGGPAAAPPAEFSLEWRRVSLSDALRLFSGGDFGVRGSLEATLVARGPRPVPPSDVAQRSAGANSANGGGLAVDAPEPGWKFSGTLRLADVHRWDLPLQADLPSLNLSLDAAASADRREWELREIVLQARRSKLRASAAFRLGDNSRASLRVVSGSIHLDDLLAWYRAFHPGVRPGTWVDGYLGADVELRGWPIAIVHATLATTGARLNVAGETSSLEIRRAVLEADAKGARLGETQFAVGRSDAGVRLAARASWTPGVPFEASLAGSTAHLAELSTAIAALGISPTAHPLRAEGSASVQLKWKGFARPWQLATSGSLGLEDVALTGGLLRSGISVGKARLDFLAGQRRLQIAATRAFGATWTGSLRAPTLAGPWEFALSADRLNPPALVRGFSSEPPENSSLLSRILPAQAAATLAREEPHWPEWLRGEGKLVAGAMNVGRLQFERLKGRLIIGQRGIVLEDAEAGVYGGRVRGDVRADFGEQPRYAVRAEFDGVNLASISSVAVSTRQCCTGTASGRVALNAAGWNRDALLASLAGTGRAEVRSGALLTLDLPATLDAAALRPGRTAVRAASAEFTFAGGRVLLDRLALDLPPNALEGKGSASFRGELDVALASRPGNSGVVQLTGTLAVPQITAEGKRVP